MFATNRVLQQPQALRPSHCLLSPSDRDEKPKSATYRDHCRSINFQSQGGRFGFDGKSLPTPGSAIVGGEYAMGGKDRNASEKTVGVGIEDWLNSADPSPNFGVE